MERESVWLGSLREPVRLGMIASGAVAIALFVWLVFDRKALGGDIGMHEMIRPEGRPLVSAMLWATAISLFFVSLYTSDDKGAIEAERTGPFDILSLILGRMAMLGTGFIVIVMVYEVVSRYAFERPTLWANEMSLWIASFVFLLSGLYAMQQRSHIRIYIIYDMMPRWAQKTSDCMSVFLIWVFVFCLNWGTYNESVQKWARFETFGTAWDPPIPATIKMGIPVIITLVAFQALSNLIADWNKAPEHHSPADEIDEVEIERLRQVVEEKR
jgi:TRAP-type C4-dicarboxylate transport system permease small subunit